MEGDNLPLDRLLALLANHRRRYALYYLHGVETRVVTLDELADRLQRWELEWDRRAEPTSAGHRERIRLTLHHEHLPRLADANLLDYDAHSRTVRNREERAVADLVRTDSMELPHLRALFRPPSTK